MMLEGDFDTVPCETVDSVIGEMTIPIDITLNIHRILSGSVFHSYVDSVAAVLTQ